MVYDVNPSNGLPSYSMPLFSYTDPLCDTTNPISQAYSSTLSPTVLTAVDFDTSYTLVSTTDPSLYGVFTFTVTATNSQDAAMHASVSWTVTIKNTCYEDVISFTAGLKQPDVTYTTHDGALSIILPEITNVESTQCPLSLNLSGEDNTFMTWTPATRELRI